MDTKKMLGNHIKQLRIERKMSQRQFALMIGMDRTFLSTIESGHQNVSIDTLEKIAKGLGLTVADLFRAL
jgi:transcriptional regulator with XRE-family HTH domain